MLPSCLTLERVGSLLLFSVPVPFTTALDGLFLDLFPFVLFGQALKMVFNRTMAPNVTMDMIPLPPSALAMEFSKRFVGIALTLNAIATIVFVGRIWTRSYPLYRMQIDDWIIAVAWVSLSTSQSTQGVNKTY